MSQQDKLIVDLVEDMEIEEIEKIEENIGEIEKELVKSWEYRDYCKKLDLNEGNSFQFSDRTNAKWKRDQKINKQTNRDKNGWILKQYGIRNSRNVKRSSHNKSNKSPRCHKRNKLTYSSDFFD